MNAVTHEHPAEERRDEPGKKLRDTDDTDDKVRGGCSAKLNEALPLTRINLLGDGTTTAREELRGAAGQRT